MSSSSLNVDQRIVQMQFDNAQFEQGVTTTMSTLDKLKNSLNFTGQTNSLDSISKSVSQFTAAPMVSAIETAKSKFSALEIAAITAISNITTKVQMMGERLISAITIDPLKSGWSEYEEKMDSIKTILNSAKDKNGMAVSLDQVKKKIEELNVYADKTIYSFSDMTNNIGKFTNAGVDLDTATAAIQGISNAAAAAGADSNAASRAMYNFAQSLSTGFVQRIDWKSIENANMATVEFKDELLKTAAELKTVEKNSDGTYMALTKGTKTMKESAGAAAMFTENLATGWLTNDVLIKTLNRYSDATTEIGKKAQEAATRVFTFSKMVDTLGESLQSGWSATWEKIVGDYEQAGDLFTGINNYISGIFDANANKRVAFLDKLLNNLGTVKKRHWQAFEDAQKNKKDLETYIDVVKKVAREHNIDIDRMIQDHGSFAKTLKEGWFTQDVMDDVNKYIDGLGKAKKAGKELYTKDQIKYLKSLTSSMKEGKTAASAYTDLVGHAGKTGRELILESFTALFKQVERIFKHIGAAYNSIFPKTSVTNVYKALKAFHEFATTFKVARQMRKDIRRTFKGIFSIFDIFKMAVTAVGRGIGTIIKHVAQFSGSFLGLTSNLGMSIMSLRNWIKNSKIFDNAVNAVVTVICAFLDAIQELHILDYIKNSLSVVADVLFKIIGFVIALVGKILSSKAFSFILNTVLSILLKILYVIGNIIPWTIEFIKYLASLPKVSAAIKSIQEFFKNIASYAYSGLIFVLDKIHGFIDYVSSSSGLKFISGGLGKAVGVVIDFVSSGISKVKTFVGNFLELESVQNIIEKVKDFFGDFTENVKKLGSAGLEDIKNFFETISEKLPDSETVLKTIDGLLDGSIDKGQFIKDVLSDIHKGLEKILDKLKEIAKTKIPFLNNNSEITNEADTQGNALVVAGTTLQTDMKLFVEKIKEGFSFISSGKLFSIAAWASTIFIFIQIGRAIGALGKVIRNFSFDYRSPLGKFIRSFTKDLNASANQTNATAFETLSKGIAIIAASLIALTKVDSDKLSYVAASLFIVLMGIRLVVGMIAKIMDNKVESNGNPLEEALSNLANKLGQAVKKGLKIVSLGFAFAGVAAGIFFLVKSLTSIYEIINGEGFNWKALLASGVIILAFIGAIIGALWLMNKLKLDSTKEMALSILAFGVSIRILVSALNAIPTDDKLGNRLFGLAVTMGILLGSLLALGKIAKKGDTSPKELAGSMILLSIAINLLAIPLAVLSLIPPKRIMAVGAALFLLTLGMSALIAVTKIMVSSGGDGIVKTILGVSVAMLILSTALGSLAKVPVDSLKTAGIAMGILVAALMVLGFVANIVGPGLVFLGQALLGFGIAAAGFGIAAYLIVAAIGMLGPALDSLVTGFVAFSEKLQANAGIITAGIVTLIGIICTAIIAKKVMLSEAAFSVFTGLFEGGQAAILSMLPKSKVLIIALVFFLLGVLDTIMPGAVSKIVGIIARAIDSLAKAIATKSGPLVSAVFHLIGAIGILVLEIFQQIFEGIRTFIKDLTGFDIETILPKSLSIEESRKRIEEMKSGLTKSIDENSQEISDSYDKGTKEINEAAEKWSSATNVDNAKQEQLGEKRHVVDSPEESYQYGYKSGEAEAQGQADGANNKTSSLNLDFINSLFDKDGMLDMSKMTGVEVGDIFGEGFSSVDLTGFMNGESSEMFTALESNLGGDKLGQLTSWASTEMENNFDLSGVEKKVDETAEHVKKKNKEMADSTPETPKTKVKEEKITKKTTVKEEVKVDKSSSEATMKSSAEDAANTWQKTFSKKQTSIKNTVTNIMKSAAKGAGASSVYNEFHDSAVHSANGILSGLEAKMDDLYRKGVKMGLKVNEGYRSGKSQDISSPSKLMYKNALFTVQGLLNGFSDNEKNLFDSGASMGRSVNSGAKTALAQMSAMLSEDIDSTPTIRPVLDLSDIARGAGQINGMLTGRTLSVNSLTASRLSSAMNARQNRTDPVLMALDNLSRNLMNQQPTNTYNINGITYDDGSNIASAIGVIARAAIVEGRA